MTPPLPESERYQPIDTFDGEWLRQVRINLKLTQEQFANIAGFSQTTISSWERGEKTPSWELAQDLQDAVTGYLGCDMLLKRLQDTGCPRYNERGLQGC